MRVRRGFSPQRFQELALRSVGGKKEARVQISELERFEMKLGEGRENRFWSGGLQVGEELRPLPVGSTLEPRAGRFMWMPGPGFLGEFTLVFAARKDGRVVAVKKVKVIISPKTYRGHKDIN